MMAKRKAAQLTHLDAANRPTMVDVGNKAATPREAIALARVRLPRSVANALADDHGSKPRLQSVNCSSTHAAARSTTGYQQSVYPLGQQSRGEICAEKTRGIFFDQPAFRGHAVQTGV